jgi:hypothetical protein
MKPEVEGPVITSFLVGLEDAVLSSFPAVEL